MDSQNKKPADAMEVDEEKKASSSKPTVVRARALSVPYNTAPPNYTVGYVYSSEMTTHLKLGNDPHPEQPQRIVQIWKTLISHQYNQRMLWLPIRQVSREEALLVHTEDHWDKVQAIQYMQDQQIIDSEAYYEQLSLYVMAGTTRAALLSCGGVIEAALAVAKGKLKKTFAIVRPPGHHAEPDEHMGFCFFNNVAVAARVVQQLTSIKKILILDWDVHHGNGTQRAFNDDPSVLYISLHRYEQGSFYPTGPFGSMQSCGEEAGLGYSVNIPWPCAEMGDADYIHAFQKIVMPIGIEFAPDLVMISAGFDAAAGDELGECLVSPAGYAHMTHMLAGLANGRMVVALEGGYNLDSISVSALAVTKVLLGEAPDQLPPLTASEEATETVWLVAKEQSKYWKSVDPRACEPREDIEDMTFSIPEILKAHRQHYLYTEHGMMQIPLLRPEMEQRLSAQFMCSSDLFTNKTLVVFIHEFGNLRMELESSATCDVELERSYLIDFSKSLIEWVKTDGYALLDANLFPKPPAIISSRTKSTEEIGRDTLVYIWDNYIQLSGATKIILIGHGPGCQALVNLMDKRSAGIVKCVKAVIQVVGPQKMPTVPMSSDTIRDWYRKHSFLIVPSTHPSISPHSRTKTLRRHKAVIEIEETRQIKLIMTGLPAIQSIVQEAFNKKSVNNTTSAKSPPPAVKANA
ncbi:histone deacetylase complex protein [Macrolepiota fuliginosa MF-IS2]|uniref:histone deacetylase n=1 Tax=Macrolepiota fuliginosa MF-IS2 TaxID=1400762 RepID=A0A9P5XIZ0_9AGAR|nr:histone deacetylase complex protein [Macrolepiota fuliginosa MF-IS2]